MAGGGEVNTLANKLALWWLGYQMRKHPDYAWSWHCNLAMMAYDTASARLKCPVLQSLPMEANQRAAGFMSQAFNVNMNINPIYIDWLKSAREAK